MVRTALADMPDKSELPEVCAVYIVRLACAGHEVLLGRKKKGLGQGQLVAPGGKLEPGESPSDAAVREVYEEVGIELQRDRLKLIGDLKYPFPHREEWSQRSWVYFAEYHGGEPTESSELSPAWFPIDDLPLAEMWDDAKYWLPAALGGAFVSATFAFGLDGLTVESSDHESFPR
jgi:8-oxo-dGTP diphosphatase